MKPVDLICRRTGRLASSSDVPDGAVGDHEWLPLVEAEPYFSQVTGSDAEATDRTSDGRFDRTHLSPEHAYRIGRDFLAHCIRYGWPMKVIRDRFGAGARILEMGCGRDLALFRTLTMDHQSARYYKPSRYVGCDLNPVKYHPKVSGIETTILEGVNCVDEQDKVPDEAFDLVCSFEVVEHMGKDDGIAFLSAMTAFARRKFTREGKPGLLLMSTPVNNGSKAKNHIYEWYRGEMRRNLENLGCTVVGEYGTFSNLYDLVPVLTEAEAECWNRLADYHSPHTLSCLFSAGHPEAARNIAWLAEVRA